MGMSANDWIKDRRSIHDANECWKQTGGEQCGCGWMGVPDE